MENGIKKFIGGKPDQFKYMGMAETHPDIVYVTNVGTDGPPPNHYTVYKTTDGGKNWKHCFYNDYRQPGCNTEVSWISYDRSRGYGDRALSFSVNAGNPDQVFYTNYGEIFITINGGKSWYQSFSRRSKGQGKPGQDFRHRHENHHGLTSELGAEDIFAMQSVHHMTQILFSCLRT